MPSFPLWTEGNCPKYAKQLWSTSQNWPQCSISVLDFDLTSGRAHVRTLFYDRNVWKVWIFRIYRHFLIGIMALLKDSSNTARKWAVGENTGNRTDTRSIFHWGLLCPLFPGGYMKSVTLTRLSLNLKFSHAIFERWSGFSPCDCGERPMSTFWGISLSLRSNTEVAFSISHCECSEIM